MKSKLKQFNSNRLKERDSLSGVSDTNSELS